MELIWVGAGAAAALVLLGGLALWRRGSAGERASKAAHEAAQEREPPVDVGQSGHY